MRVVGGGMHEGGCYVVMCVVEALLPLPHCHLQHCKALPRSQKHGGVQQRARNSSSSAAPRRRRRQRHKPLVQDCSCGCCACCYDSPSCIIAPQTTPGSRTASREAGAAGCRGPTAAAGTRRHEAHARKPAQPASSSRRGEGCSAACLVDPKCRQEQTGG